MGTVPYSDEDWMFEQTVRGVEKRYGTRIGHEGFTGRELIPLRLAHRRRRIIKR